jgi:hypothetical protein
MSQQPYVYPSGFVVGEQVVVHDNGKRKYNKHIDIPDGTVLQVEENPNLPDSLHLWPHDAVQVRTLEGGHGAVDAACLRREQ